MTTLFLSHSSRDDAFVRDLQRALGGHRVEAWIDSRELLPGGLLEPDIARAIDGASGFAVVVSPDGLQSKWVGKELRRALEVQKARGRDAYPVVALSLDGTKLGVLEEFFDGEPLYVPVTSDAGGVDAAVHEILVALGLRLPTDVPPAPQPRAEPLEELVLELTDLGFREEGGTRRASARARLVHEPATPGQREVASTRSWRFVAPIGPIEAEELRWYLERYAIWPSEYFRARAQRVEASLVEWGRLLHGAALPPEHVANVLQAWARLDTHADRRFSIHVDVDATLEAGASDADVRTAREAATLLLGLPWELLHDGEGFLFQGAKPTRVRRRLPNTRVLDVPVVATPIRILVVAPRPEDDACGYFDHRSSSLPLVDTTESLGGLVSIRILAPPTLSALRKELDRARGAREPYHVVHFDGHGVYDPVAGLGGLCFEDERDASVLDRRRHVIVPSSQLGELLRDHRIPLVVLDACQTALAAQASDSVASELLRVGVASVVAMSHSVLVVTARRFVEAFYGALAAGSRVGDAMLQGQRTLKDDPLRGRVFGAGDLRLEDWFVPVLFQEKEDPQLFRATPARRTQDDVRTDLAARLGELPAVPETGFIGRSRELLALERLLRRERYAVVRGQGGEGKTALAAELARWMVRSRQVRRAAFVSVELYSTAAAVLDAIGRQLVSPKYSVAAFENLEKALLPVERELVEQSTLLVIDNMESVLLPPYLETPDALSEEARRELEAILRVCARLVAQGDTRLVFTSREALPAPFDAEGNRRELHRLGREDAVKFVERVLNREAADAGAATDSAREEIEGLVDAVHGHARTLTLLAPSLRDRGVEATRESLVELMAEMERRFPGSREWSLFASVELSLRRLSPENRERARVLGVFHGAVDLDLLHAMTRWERANLSSLAQELIGTGLATSDGHNHLTLNPALCPYLRSQLDATELEALTARWCEATVAYVDFLAQMKKEAPELVNALTGLELANLFALADRVARAGNVELTIDVATLLFRLLEYAGRPQLLERVGAVRDAAAAALGESWNQARFKVADAEVDEHLAQGRVRDAVAGAERLLQRARVAGEDAYTGADYDLAMAHFTLGRVLKFAGRVDEALQLVGEAQQRFEHIAITRSNKSAGHMAAACFTERGDCLQNLGRLDEAATAYEEAIRRGEAQANERGVAVRKGQLATVRMLQGRFQEALDAYLDTLRRFTQLDEPRFVAVSWHQIGMLYRRMRRLEMAEDAYRRSLAICVRIGDVAGEVGTIHELATLYDDVGRSEEAAILYRQAADKYVLVGDEAGEGRARNNLSIVLRKLGRLDEAREEILTAIRQKTPFGHSQELWKSWDVLSGIEADAGRRSDSAQARRRAVECYLAYRRDGGENRGPDGALALAVARELHSGNRAGPAAALQQLMGREDLPEQIHAFVDALLAVVSGQLDRTLADNPALHYAMAAEILLLIESLEKAESSRRPGQ